MEILIMRNGILSIKRGNTWKVQRCRFARSEVSGPEGFESIERPFCSDDCPHFGEVLGPEVTDGGLVLDRELRLCLTKLKGKINDERGKPLPLEKSEDES